MIALDTFSLLRNIAAASKTFEAVEPELEKAAVAAVKKVLKTRGLTLERLHEIRRAIGPDALAFVVGHDSMKDSDVKSLVKQLDKHWPELSAARVDELRAHFLALAQGARVPSEKVVVARPASKRPAPKSKPADWSTAMGAKATKR